MSYGENYQDRGMVKWAGFYLSEHTNTLSNQTVAEKNCPQQKMQMDVDEIGTILSEAQLKNKQVAIQIEERDVNGYYKADTVGFIKGYDELGIFVGGTKIGYDEIRHVEFSNELKWSNTKRFKI
ncbi:MAG: hypothetical protein L0G21_10030 [Lactococcus raffinolactis]|uniref:hypothetical protein n=1 Tax=Enterococcus sp. TaxID=35783 RepID=UPI001B5F61EA|nr:hypothetical protein [Enterococcus sp.]MDN5397111.1 hypothetical protein [Chryseobacterium sp.]MDN5414222.1 hypothetical protein [Lactococcus raffinolactis]MDN6023957.1 hypothetical protein [Lactobacillus sp.]MBP8751235.1 hypothetical protein [Enterococcus sp.]MDN5495558.1 hypothetical protein [Lactococcus raffinolactis]